MWSKTLGVGLHKLLKRVGQENFQLKTRQTFGKDCNADPASLCLDLNAILQMFIYVDFRSFFLHILLLWKDCYQVINLIKQFSDLSTIVLVAIWTALMQIISITDLNMNT